MLAYTVDGTALANSARWISDAGSAFDLTPMRGEDLVIPGMPGAIPLGRVLDVTYDEFEIRVSGLTDESGAPATDDSAQFLSNLRALQQLLRPEDGSTISVTKTLTTAAGAVVLGPAEARCESVLSPRMEAPWTGLVLVRLKVYGGWA